MKYLRIIPILLFVITFTFNLSAQTALELLIKAEDSSDNKYCIELAKQAIAIAEKENDKGLIASANGQIAFCLMNLGQLDEAEKFVDKITEMAESSGNSHALYYEWSVKGNIYSLKKDHANAFLCFEKALPYSQKLDDSYYVRGTLLSLISSGIRAGKDPSISIEYCNQALAYPDSKRGPNQKFNILAQLGNIYFYFLDNSSKAIDYYSQADVATDLPDQNVFVAQQIAEAYQNMSNPSAAIEYLQKALKKLTGKISKTQEADLLIKLAAIYDVGLKDNAKAIEYYNQAAIVSDQPDQKGQIAKYLSIIYENMGKSSFAIDQLQKDLKNLTGKLSKNVQAELIAQIGSNYQKLKEFAKAIDYYNQADALNDDPFTKALIATHLGTIYADLSNTIKAIEYYKKAQKIYEELDYKSYAALVQWNIACCYAEIQQNQNAIDYVLRIIPIYKELDDKEKLVDCYGKLGVCYMWIGKYAESISWAQQALNLANEINNPKKKMVALFSLGRAEVSQSRQKSLDFLKEGYSIAKDINDDVYIDNFEKWIGLTYDLNDDYTQAIPFYLSIIDRREKERALVPDDLKLNYWSGQYVNYQNIIRCQLSMQDYQGAFNSIEKSTARLLLERIASKAGKNSNLFVDPTQWQKNIPQEQAILCFGNIGNKLTTILTDANSIDGIGVNDDIWVKSVKDRYSISDISSFEKLRAFKRIQNPPNTELAVNQPQQENWDRTKREIEKIANNYRSLLSKPIKTPAEKETIDFLGKKFYELLILPVEDKLVGKKELVIIPNDLLAFLPYEAFIMPDGRYLVEKYDIRYLPSLSVGNELANRKYSDNRKPLLAFGNAVYDVPNAQTQQTQSQEQFNEMMKGVETDSKDGVSMKRYYDALGIAWENLSGTLAELDAISGLVPNSVCIKGKDVNEQSVKGMSANGQLKGYKILHFATHGIVIPEYQDLSALVLSQGLPNDDGYLRASEIAKLNLNADFVNLSACETGLGKIYGGEGVVGLTQSFLLAGANSIAVSLWKVSDQSTMEFQKEFYRLVFVEKMPISKAINQVKRTFIKGQYNQPFYWAPFVYYGM
ncbi:hypothetical protein CYCD_24900 [Tenuifilaceae bacterium CYCD]|nr:hypothetical protein CYCD_24900 [Tenuifilaceae bacterium CYCD]